MKSEAILAIVIPMYNEGEVIQETASVLNGIIDNLVSVRRVSDKSFLLFVDDGSSDESWQKFCTLREKLGGRRIKGIKLSRNRGHQIALYAGMKAAVNCSDIIITIDADLQQDPDAIYNFLDKYEAGYDIVYGVRNDRKTDSLFKKLSGTLYYRLLKLLGCEVIEQSADYRLMSKRAVESLMEYKETNLFIRGIIPMMGFNSTVIYFDVRQREYGKTKYSMKKMFQLAIDGVTSLSIKPLRLFFFIGVIVVLFSIGLLIFNLVTYLKGMNVPGWTSISMTMLFLGGVELIGIGVQGEYIGRIYMETKKRPLFFVDEAMLSDD